MITTFKDKEIRETGIVNKGMFEQIKLLHAQGQTAIAGELAISCIEMVLTGDYSSDDFMIQFAMANHSVIAEKNAAKYDKKLEASREARKEKLELEKIADLVRQGVTQTAIATQLGVNKSTISKRLDIIRTDYPELLVDESCQSCQSCQDDNLNYNYNDNDNEYNLARSARSLPRSEGVGGLPPKPPSQQKSEFRF